MDEHVGTGGRHAHPQARLLCAGLSGSIEADLVRVDVQSAGNTDCENSGCTAGRWMNAGQPCLMFCRHECEELFYVLRGEGVAAVQDKASVCAQCNAPAALLLRAAAACNATSVCRAQAPARQRRR